MEKTTIAAMRNRRDRLRINPHNIPGIAGCPPMVNREYWKARFEHEGSIGLANPYKPGTMAADCWEAGFRLKALEIRDMV
jgi:hypothetical protein